MSQTVNVYQRVNPIRSPLNHHKITIFLVVNHHILQAIPPFPRRRTGFSVAKPPSALATSRATCKRWPHGSCRSLRWWSKAWLRRKMAPQNQQEWDIYIYIHIYIYISHICISYHIISYHVISYHIIYIYDIYICYIYDIYMWCIYIYIHIYHIYIYTYVYIYICIIYIYYIILILSYTNWIYMEVSKVMGISQ